MISADDSVPHSQTTAAEQEAPAEASTTHLPEPSRQIDATDHPAAEQTTSAPDHPSGDANLSQTTISTGDSADDPTTDAAEQAPSAPTATAPRSQPVPRIDATDDSAAEQRAGSTPSDDEPVSRQQAGTVPVSAPLPWLDALRFSWLDAPNGPQTSAGATDTASGHETGPRPHAIEADSVAQQWSSTDNFEASRGTGHPASGGPANSVPFASHDRPGTAAPDRKPDAASQTIEVSDTAHRPGHTRHAADDADPVGTAHSSTRPDGAHPPQAGSRTSSAANSSSQRSDPATPKRTGSTGATPVQRTDPTRKNGRALIERGDAARRPAVAQQADAPDPAEALRIAREMSARHGLEVVGFETGNVGLQVIREIASAIDELLTKYPMPLRGVELTDDAQPRPRPDRDPTAAQSADAPIWLLLDRAALSPPRSAQVETRRIFRRRGPAERPVYTAVVREFAGALDVAGAFRARQEALRTLINESLRGGGGGLGLLDPGRALIDGFTEVALRGERAGATAKELHGALVKMARVESSDDLSA